jgi:hypothetical protein
MSYRSGGAEGEALSCLYMNSDNIHEMRIYDIKLGRVQETRLSLVVWNFYSLICRLPSLSALSWEQYGLPNWWINIVVKSGFGQVNHHTQLSPTRAQAGQHPVDLALHKGD